MAESVALAALEVLVHFSVLPSDYALTEVVIPERAIFSRVDESVLPLNWNADVPRNVTQSLGDAWVQSNQSPVLSVPSSIVPGSRNFLLNPGHPAFGEIEFRRSTPFRFDPRLK